LQNHVDRENVKENKQCRNNSVHKIRWLGIAGVYCTHKGQHDDNSGKLRIAKEVAGEAESIKAIRERERARKKPEKPYIPSAEELKMIDSFRAAWGLTEKSTWQEVDTAFLEAFNEIVEKFPDSKSQEYKSRVDEATEAKKLLKRVINKK